MQVQGTGYSFLSNQSLTEKSLKRNSRELDKILERLSTSMRINRASDDAAGLAISEQLRSQIRGFKMASQNIEDAMSALSIADGAGQQVSEILQRQRELAISAKNGTLTDDQRGSIDKEFQALNEEISRISQSTEFNRQKVASGQDLSSGTASIQTGADPGDTLNLPETDFTSTSLGISGLSVATQSDAANALSAIDNALENLSSQRSTIGAFANRLGSAINNLQVASVNSLAAESVLRDQDMAEGLARLTSEQIIREGTSKAFSRFNEISRNQILGLLQ